MRSIVRTIRGEFAADFDAISVDSLDSLMWRRRLRRYSRGFPGQPGAYVNDGTK
jgi:hypothetical protein